ncbi:MAG: hypothetical protein IGS48_06600 [Oscillatoriales cyanobacterium C42_A2020_001]|nr:hypothetical protein [Leptolyngbyaceae cyanobacterium C42_A2020_001]
MAIEVFCQPAKPFCTQELLPDYLLEPLPSPEPEPPEKSCAGRNWVSAA